MIQQGLVPSIQSYMKQGYPKNTIISYFSAYGHDAKDVSDTYDYLAGQQAGTGSGGIRRKTIIIAGGAAVLVILAVTLYFFYPQSSSGDGQFYFVASVPSAVPYGISHLTYSISFVSPNTKLRTILTERIIDAQGQEVYSTQSPVSSAVMPDRRIDNLALAPGSYTLELRAKHGTDVYDKRLVFSVQGEPTPYPQTEGNVLCRNGIMDAGEEGIDCGGPCRACTSPMPSITPAQACPYTCDDENSCTLDTCTPHTFQCIHTQIMPCCGNGVCEPLETAQECPTDCGQGGQPLSDFTPFQIIERAALLAPANIEAAALQCRTLNPEDQNACFDRIAHASGKSDVCALVTGSLQSSCYMDFAMGGDYSVCDKVQNKYLRDSCENLQQLANPPFAA